MMEEWRAVPGYEGLYEVSSYGRVRSLDKYDSMNRFCEGRILKLFADTGGYLSVVLYSNSKRKHHLVHRLVAEAFIPNPDNLPQINHKDENPSNDNVDNLEWCDGKYNVNYGTRIDRIRDIRLKNGTYTGLSKEEYHKKYYEKNKEKIIEQHREYYEKNKEKRREHMREYMKKNREQNREYMREYRKKRKNK